MAGGVSVRDLDVLIQSLQRAVRARAEFIDAALDFCGRVGPSDFRQPGMTAKVLDLTAAAQEAKRQDAEIAAAMARCSRMLTVRTVN